MGSGERAPLTKDSLERACIIPASSPHASEGHGEGTAREKGAGNAGVGVVPSGTTSGCLSLRGMHTWPFSSIPIPRDLLPPSEPAYQGIPCCLPLAELLCHQTRVPCRDRSLPESLPIATPTPRARSVVLLRPMSPGTARCRDDVGPDEPVAPRGTEQGLSVLS